MKKRRVIALAVAFGVVVSIAALTMYGRGQPVLVSSGRLTLQEVSTIQRDHSRLQWENVRKALTSADPFFLVGSLRNIAFVRVREIGSPLAGYAVVRTGYVWNSNTVWDCDLVRGSNGWHVP